MNFSQNIFAVLFGPTHRKLMNSADLALRLTIGLSFFAHGWGKLMDPVGMAAFLSQEGYWAPQFLAWLLILTEVVGGLLISLGLLIRPATLAAVVFMFVAISFQKWENGYFYYSDGFEIDLLYLVLALNLFLKTEIFL